jgi:hypothetical protein
MPDRDRNWIGVLWNGCKTFLHWCAVKLHWVQKEAETPSLARIAVLDAEPERCADEEIARIDAVLPGVSDTLPPAWANPTDPKIIALIKQHGGVVTMRQALEAKRNSIARDKRAWAAAEKTRLGAVRLDEARETTLEVSR